MEEEAAVKSYSAALGHAVNQGNVKLAKELLKAGANVNHKIFETEDPEEDDDFFSPITSAVSGDHLEMVKLLLQYNPNLNDHNVNGGQLPLVLAIRNGCLKIVKTLLDHPGTIVNAREYSSRFALAQASDYGLYDLVEQLVSLGKHTKNDYSDALVYAADNKDTKILRLLLEHGADPNYTTLIGHHTPLYYSIRGHKWEAVRLLLHSGATTELPFRHMIRGNDLRFDYALEWLSEGTTRTILGLKEMQLRQTEPYYWDSITGNWDGIVASLWFRHFGLNWRGDPPRIEATARFSKRKFKTAHTWMIHAVSTLLFLHEANLLLPHLCYLLDPSVALEPCEHTGKTPLLLALEICPRQNETEQQNAASGTDLLIQWNPDSLKVPDPETQRIPMTCAIVKRVPLPTLQTMITCKNEEWFTAAPKQQDPVTLLPNFLLVAAGKDGYSVSDIYAFSRDFLPGIIASTLKSPTRVSRRGTKRSLEQI